MLLKQDIASAFAAQKAEREMIRPWTHRKFLESLNTEGSHIEVFSGIRRCGKSTLMRHIMQQYGGTATFFNFEDARIYGFDVGDFPKLDEVMGTGKKTYFFDEIQNVADWEVFIRQLHDRGEKVFVTGSNASLLSRELGTRLTGRYISNELFPFSYSEFLDHTGQKSGQKSVNQFLRQGGFPEYLDSGRTEMLQTLFKDIVLRDIAIRHGIRNTTTLMNIALHLLSNVGKETSFGKLARSFSIGSVNSVSDYVSWLCDSYLLFLVPKFSRSPRKQAVNQKKVYAVDNGLVVANTLSLSEDRGRLLENAVFMHLRQHHDAVFYYQGKGECDFVAFDGTECVKVVQVCEEVDRDNRQRELNGLIEAMDELKMRKGIIVTQKQQDTLEQDGKQLELIPIDEFLLIPE